MSTLREHIDQQIREIDYWLTGNQTTFGNLGLLRLLREHAVASLAILDAAGKYPQPQVHSEGYLQTAAGHYAYRLVPDPPVSS